MTLPEFVPSIAADIRRAIEAQLERIAFSEGVRILFAIESGSRAWGFPSPDSDYDVRFVYAHPRDWYLSLVPGRDVIEPPISNDLDIGGWDIRKALNLLLKPNPVMLEWLSSPIRYRWDETACDALVAFADKTTHQKACRYHYLSLGESQWAKHVGHKEDVNFKKYFYILRPALALRWLRLNSQSQPPMNLQKLVEKLELNDIVLSRIATLLEQKSKAKEMGRGARIPEIDALIQHEFDLARAVPPAAKTADLTQEATELFRRIVKGQI